jgi:hypothetical protein
MPTPFRDQYARARARVMGCYSGGIVSSARAELLLSAPAQPASEGQSNGLRSAKQARAEKAERVAVPPFVHRRTFQAKKNPASHTSWGLRGGSFGRLSSGDSRSRAPKIRSLTHLS